MKHDLLSHWSSNLLLNDLQHLCSTWKASCHDGIIYIPVETKSSEHEFPTLRIMGSQNWWFGDPKEPYVIAESNPYIGRVLHDSWGSENGSISSFNMNQHLNPRKRTNDNGKSPPSLNRKHIFNLVDFPWVMLVFGRGNSHAPNIQLRFLNNFFHGGFPYLYPLTQDAMVTTMMTWNIF